MCIRLPLDRNIEREGRVFYLSMTKHIFIMIFDMKDQNICLIVVILQVEVGKF